MKKVQGFDAGDIYTQSNGIVRFYQELAIDTLELSDGQQFVTFRLSGPSKGDAGSSTLQLPLKVFNDLLRASGVIDDIRRGKIPSPTTSERLYTAATSANRLAEQLRELPISEEMTDNVRLIGENLTIATNQILEELEPLLPESDGDEGGQYGDLR